MVAVKNPSLFILVLAVAVIVSTESFANVYVGGNVRPIARTIDKTTVVMSNSTPL